MISDKPNIRITTESQVFDTENMDLISKGAQDSSKDVTKVHSGPGRSKTDKELEKPPGNREATRSNAGRSVTVIEKGPEIFHKSKDFFSPERKPQGSENGYHMGT